MLICAQIIVALDVPPINTDHEEIISICETEGKNFEASALSQSNQVVIFFKYSYLLVD